MLRGIQHRVAGEFDNPLLNAGKFVLHIGPDRAEALDAERIAALGDEQFVAIGSWACCGQFIDGLAA